jgi:hypothetical protein
MGERVYAMKMMRFLILILVTTLAACGSAAAPEEPNIASPEPPTPTAPPSVEMASPPPTPTSPSASSPLSPLPAPTIPGGETAETGGRVAEFPNTIVVYQRDSQKWTIYVGGRIVGGDGSAWTVPAEEVKPLFGAVEADAFWELEEGYGAAEECPDCPLQRLTVYREGQIKEITVIEGAAGLPPILDQTLDTLERLIVLQ